MHHQQSVVWPLRPVATVSAVVGAKQGLLRPGVDCVHHGFGGELEVALFVEKDLAEMGLAQAVADLVQRDRFDVDVGYTVVRPDTGWAEEANKRIVIDLAEGGIKKTVVVDVGEDWRGHAGVAKGEAEGRADRAATELEVAPAGMLDVRDEGLAHDDTDVSCERRADERQVRAVQVVPTVGGSDDRGIGLGLSEATCERYRIACRVNRIGDGSRRPAPGPPGIERHEI